LEERWEKSDTWADGTIISKWDRDCDTQLAFGIYTMPKYHQEDGRNRADFMM